MFQTISLASVFLPLLVVEPQASLAAERVTIPSSGWALIGNYVRPSTGEPLPAVLLLHGAARDRRAYLTLSQELARRGVASLRIDLRGAGESTNLGRFEPGGAPPRWFGETHRDVAAALTWLRAQPGVDSKRIGVLGASYTGEAMAVAARYGAAAAAYVALSPGDFSEASTRAIDHSGIPWWFIASADERFAQSVVRGIPATSRTARTTIVEGTSHASDILSPHVALNAEIADWFASRLQARSSPELWGSLQPGAFDVGFRRESITAGGRSLLVDIWFPARGAGNRLRFEDYLRLSTDLRGAVAGFPDRAGSLEATLSTAITGNAGALPPETARRILQSAMAATRDASSAGRFPLVLWTPRYATTVAQSVLSEFLASHGFVVAFARPASGGKLPFELPAPEAKLAELRDRVDDMRAAIEYLGAQPYVDTRRIGLLAWSYTGEMATQLQLSEPRVGLVAGLSTTLLSDWVFQPRAAADTLDPAKLSAAYAVLTERGPAPPPPPVVLGRINASYLVEFPGLAHGSFNALEGYVPSRFGITPVQRWSQSSAAGVAGYEATAVILVRLLRHHVESSSPRPLSRLQLLTGLAPGVAELVTSPGDGMTR